MVFVAVLNHRIVEVVVCRNLITWATQLPETIAPSIISVGYINVGTNCFEDKEYIIKTIDTDDEEMKSFLFTLGCYEGEPITIISRLKGGCVVSIKDSRYKY